MIVNSPAKLNLYLEILNKRPDSYHNLRTLFERIDLCDQVILKSRQDGQIKITSTLPALPQGRRNFAFRSAEILKQHFQINKGIDIKIIKRIPLASGLGGGSSNAAAVLLGLNILWKLNLSQKDLVSLAAKIGSDVPFFIYDSPFAWGEARGDRIKPLKKLKRLRLWHILVVPKIAVSTASIYRAWDNLWRRLTKPKYDVKILTLALEKKDLPLIGKALFNSLEQVSIKLYPQIGEIKDTLRQRGAKAVLMSGSGPAVYGMLSSKKEALSLKRQLTGNRHWQAFVARTR